MLFMLDGHKKKFGTYKFGKRKKCNHHNLVPTYNTSPSAPVYQVLWLCLAHIIRKWLFKHPDDALQFAKLQNRSMQIIHGQLLQNLSLNCLAKLT